MITVGLLNVCRGLGGAHPGDFQVREAVGLQVRETPIGFAVLRSDRRRGAIGFDGFSGLAECLQRVADRQMQLGVIRRLDQDFTVERQRLAVVAEARADRRIGGPVDSVVRIGCEQFLHLLPRAHVLVALEQCHRVLVAGGMVIRRERHHVLEEELGIVGDVEFHADLREQPHALDVIAMGQQVLANDMLGGVDFAVREHAESGEKLRRQSRELRDLTGGVLGIGGAAGHPEQHLECMPARGKRWVQIDGAQKGFDGRLR